VTLSVNFETGQLLRLDTAGSTLAGVTEKLTRNFRSQQGIFKLAGQLSQHPDGLLVVYKQDR